MKKMKMCKDGRIWGQNNKEAGTHLGILCQKYHLKRTASENKMAKKNPMYGKRHSKESKEKMSKKRRGKDNPSWKGGVSFQPYSVTFNNQLKELIRCRDNHKCQLCSCPEIECKRRLDVHHIDYNKKNCLPKNLISLCHRCNMKVNETRKYWTNYFKKQKGEKQDDLVLCTINSNVADYCRGPQEGIKDAIGRTCENGGRDPEQI